MKKLVLAAIAAASLLGLAACGDSGSKTEATPPATTTEPATPPATTTEPATPPAATTEPATPPATTDPNAPKPADPAAPAQ